LPARLAGGRYTVCHALTRFFGPPAGISKTARKRLLRDSQSLGHWHGALSAASRLPGGASKFTRRINVGSALARAAWTGFIKAARAIAAEGSFAAFEGMTSFAEINGFFGRDAGFRG